MENTSKEAIISVLAQQIVDEDKAEGKEQFKGHMMITKDCTKGFMTYKRSESDEEQTTYVKVEKQENKEIVQVSKSGATVAAIVFDRYGRSYMHYKTTAGEIRFEAKIKKMNVQLAQHIEIDITYELSNQGNKISDNRIRIVGQFSKEIKSQMAVY